MIEILDAVKTDHCLTKLQCKYLRPLVRISFSEGLEDKNPMEISDVIICLLKVYSVCQSQIRTAGEECFL